jgi:Cu/Ag efflux protein CusF
MKSIYLISALLLVAAAGAQAQGTSMPMPMPMQERQAAPSSGKSAMVMVDAEVQKLDAKKGTVVLKHGDITNLGMPSMTMGFDVENEKMLKGIKAGDKVKFHAEMVHGKPKVTELTTVR